MTACIVVPCDRQLPLTRTQLSGIQDYWTVVGGFIEAVTLLNPAATLFIDEEGKRKRLRFNERATALWWLHDPSARGADIIVGDAVLVGPPVDGEQLDVPASFAQLLFETQRFQVQARLGDEEHWTRSQRIFSDYFDAAVAALRALERWDRPEEVRVMSAE